ncbi:TRAP transporter small permease [Pelistega suis]|uniref:TRAP transporter small permease n=1 Tax=Pelistega suis TaxID=1631957 RepID=UPI00211C3432|nr:TRAP transporter small permease [Pelistega suis]MCQ9329495.1 TRAP transporter small permease [Pelistega suis]MDY3331650.1 TRAP transporter small permease [Pelistega sp.]
MSFVINKVDEGVLFVEKILLILFCAALTLIMVAQVIMRYFFSSPIFWAEEIALQFLIFTTIFGLSFLTQKKQHICIDFVVEMMPTSLKKLVNILIGIGFFALSLFFCYYSWDWVFRPDVQVEVSGTTGLPKWYTYLSFPIALSFLSWHQLVQLYKLFKKEG